MKHLPNKILKLCYDLDCWLVGSSANPNSESYRDFDILVPWINWHHATLIIPMDAKPNSFGGWKFTIDGYEIDMWPGDLSWFAQLPKFEYAYHVKTEVLIKKV